MLVIGGRIETVAKCREAGAKVIYLQHPHRFTADHVPLVHAALLADFTDWAVTRPLARSAREAFAISGVATLTEPALETAGRVTDLLGLPGNGYAVHRLLRDKLAMRRRQAEAGVGPVAAAAVVERRSLAQFAEAHGYPFIVKPADGVASMGVRKVAGPSDLAAAWRHIEQVRSEPLSAATFGTVSVDTFLAEEYLDGPEYSVEAFTFHGRHVVLAVTEKLTLPNFLEIGHAVPARLTEPVRQAVVAAATAFLDCIGVGEGPSHTEIRLTPAGPRVVESHTRPGGDRIIELVEAAYGIDLERYTVSWPVDLVAELDQAPAPRQAAATRFVLAEPGTVERVDGLEAVRAEPDVVLADLNLRPGDEVRPLAWSWDRPGQVVVTAPTTERAVARAEELAGRIRIVTR
ncbi:MAG TPA: ATP-grasp domain-containing protein [Acidimicrobiia bacterium]|nr:ATP-grasp domain-containing protein [Acidimicrobiia bacterium]